MVSRQLGLLGEDVTRAGLLKTPNRVAESLLWLTRGYEMDVAEVVGDALFDEAHQSMVMVRDIELYSLCEHHVLPFFGKAHIAYIPNGRIVGLSKLPRIVEVFARRLQVQERLTEQVADAIQDVLEPHGRGSRDRGLSSLHDDARRGEAEFEDHHVGAARVVPRRREDARRVPPAGVHAFHAAPLSDGGCGRRRVARWSDGGRHRRVARHRRGHRAIARSGRRGCRARRSQRANALERLAAELGARAFAVPCDLRERSDGR